MDKQEKDRSEISFPFDSEFAGYEGETGLPTGDRDLNAANWAEYFASFVGNGVFPLPAIGLTVRAGGGMTVSADTGKAWINGYYFSNRQVKLLETAPAESMPRIDRVAVRWDKAERRIYLCVLQGEAAVIPSPPDLVRNNLVYDLCLAEVTVNADAAEITQANIRDTRLDGGVCGIVAAAVQQVSFSTFALQFYDWWQGIQDLIDNGDFGKILHEMNRIEDDLSNIVLGITPNTELDDIEMCCGESAAGNVTFPRPFSVVPIVTATATTAQSILQITNITRRGFTCTASVAGTRINYIAVGDGGI